jgi:hypothetical protein
MKKMYSEQEVVELIKQALSSGEISGGTKLYKHFITVQMDDDSENSFGIISTQKNEYTDNVIVSIFDDNVITLLDYGTNTLLVNLSIVVGDDIEMTLYDGSLSGTSGLSIVSFEDEVTPL